MMYIITIMFSLIPALSKSIALQINPLTTHLIELIGLVLLTLIIFIFFFQRVRKLEKRKNYNAQIITNQTLIELSKKATSIHLNLHKFIEELLFTGKLITKTSRASFWELNSKDEMTCQLLIHKDKIINNAEISMPKKILPNLSNESTIISIDDVRSHPLYKNTLKKYLDKQKIKSVICVPIFIKNEIKGIICFATDKYYKKWTEEDKKLASSIANIAVTAISIHEKDVLSREKEQLIEILKIKNKKLTEFNSALSHNLREPLTQIIGFNAILSEIVPHYQDVTAKKIVEKIKESSEKIDKVINELTNIIVQKDVDITDFSTVNIENLVELAIHQLDPLIQEKSPLIAQNLRSKKFTSYEPFLYDIIIELLKNSLKFHRPDRLLEINILSHEDTDHYVLIIRDNGRGKDMKKYQNKIFKMYERIHLDVEGRGLGLYMADARAIALRGSIKIDSKCDEGTVTTLKLNKTHTHAS